MGNRTYYDILGVSSDATFEEITNAKNNLAKIYHPDANMKNNIDTTAFMQEILEAYHILSDPESRRKYDARIFGRKKGRVFRTYTVGDDLKEDTGSSSFITCWNAACKLQEIVSKSNYLLEQSSKTNALPTRFFRKIGNTPKVDSETADELNQLSLSAIGYITTLKLAGIPMCYWNQDAMNWVFIRWSQRQNSDYHSLFAKYDIFIETNKSTTEKLKLRSANKHFQNNLKRLLNYAVQ